MKCVMILCLLIAYISAEPISEVNEPIKNEVNLEEGDHFQGDVIISERQLKYMRSSKKLSKTGLIDSRYRWMKISSGQVKIPYYIEPSSPYSVH